MSTEPQVHPTSLNSFDSNHALYDKVRPEFSPEIVASFFKELSLETPYDGSKGQKLLELAVGTGKFTKQIVARGWGAPENLTAVEPSSGMLESFRKNFPNIDAREGSSYELPVEDSAYDAVIVSQGYHWFADHNSLKEIYRVLKPGGKLGFIWNFDMIDLGFNKNLKDPKQQLGISDEEIEIAKGWGQTALDAHAYDGDVPQYRKAEWRKSFENQSWFDKNNAVDFFKYSFLPFEKELIYDYWLSRSYITSLPDSEKAVFKKKIDEDIAALKPEQHFDDGKVKQFLGTHYFVIQSTK